LGKAEVEEFLDALLGTTVGAHGRALLQNLKQFILEKTEGNPFFMEEVVQTLSEEGVLRREVSVGWVVTHPTTALHIPTTVQGVLAARIDRLSRPEKELLQHLAVIGREFSLSLARQVIRQPEAELYRLLSALQSKEFLYEQPAFPEVEYTFKHALTQEVAYNSVLQERRKALHERTAQAIEALFHSQLEDHYGDLAHHYSRSGNTQKAVEYLHLAGQQAVQRSAYPEAATHFTAALEFLQTVADTPERAQQELTLQVALAAPLMVTKGFAAPEVGAVSTRALELCRQVGETPQLFLALRGAQRFYLFRAELRTARELAERLVPLAQRAQDCALLPEAHAGLGAVLDSLGELVSSRTHLEQAITLYDTRQSHSAIARVGMDLGVASLPLLAQVLWLLGYPDQALTRSRAGLTLAQEIAHPFSTAAVWTLDTGLHQFLHEARTVQQQAEAVIALSNEQGFSLHFAQAITRRGWALAMQGQEEEGIKQIQQGLAAGRATGMELWRPYHLVLLVEAYGKTGQVEEGFTALAEALGLVNKTGERMYEAELYRLKGTLALQSKASLRQVPDKSQTSQDKSEAEKEAEECFWKAIDIARKQQAKSLELRATVSLSRLWQQQDKKEEARKILAEIYGWFTEGFDTRDLQEAKALLEQLS
jgi:predicted ATPase